MLTRDFHYHLPPELIAQHPPPKRSDSRLLVIRRSTGEIFHDLFANFSQFLTAGDVLIVNDSRVIPARLRGEKLGTRGAIELLLVEEICDREWWVLLRPGKRVRAGTLIQIRTPGGEISDLLARVVAKDSSGRCHLHFTGGGDFRTLLESIGEVPLPPYIHRTTLGTSAEDRVRYQTIYARAAGSVAAPTAGLHVTKELLQRLCQLGIQVHSITLHVGYGTFAPVKADQIEDHEMHEERFEVPESTALAISRAKSTGNRVIAIGTTSLRVLESVARTHRGKIVAGTGRTRIFLYPSAEFQIVDALLTNFHLPESTLLMLVCAFASPGQTQTGRDLILRAYADAIRERYRFFSYGDAMFIL